MTLEDIKSRNLPNQTSGLVITSIEKDSPLIGSIEVNSVIDHCHSNNEQRSEIETHKHPRNDATNNNRNRCREILQDVIRIFYHNGDDQTTARLVK